MQTLPKTRETKTPPDLVEITEDGRMRLHLHPGQLKAWRSAARFIAILAGTQGGKTSFGPHLLRREMQECGPGDYMVVTPTYWLKYRDVMVPFRLSEFRDVAYTRYREGITEGHIMFNDAGQAMQSHWEDIAGNPCPNRRYTVAESHDGGYYEYRIPREKFWV